MSPGTLYRPQELAFRTQYAELKERAGSAEILLAGTPGTLVMRQGTGYAYWYRVYYPVRGRQAEQLVGRDGDVETLESAERQIEFAQWAAAQVRDLRKLQFQVADKGVAGVLVELHNRGILRAGLTLVGTLCYMAWLNELGAKAVSARTQDIDLAARQKLTLAVPTSFLEAVGATRLDFAPVPGMPSQSPSTSVKQKGRDGLRVDVLTHGGSLGKTVPIPQLMWSAQTARWPGDYPRSASNCSSACGWAANARRNAGSRFFAVCRIAAGARPNESDSTSSCCSTRTAASVAACSRSFSAFSGKLWRDALEKSLCHRNRSGCGSMSGMQWPPARSAACRGSARR